MKFTGDSFIVVFGLLTIQMNGEIQYVPCKGWSTCKSVEDTHTYLYLSHDGIQKGLYCLALHFDYSEKAPETACPKVTVLRKRGCKRLCAILSAGLV